MSESFSRERDERQHERPATAHGDSAIASLTGEREGATASPESGKPRRLLSRLLVGALLRVWAGFRAAARFRLRSAGLQGFFALVVYLAVWLFTTMRPFIYHPEIAQLNQRSMDPNFYTWAIGWWPYAITHGLNPLHPTLIGAPQGFDLTWITSVPVLSLLAWPLTAHSGPVVSFNILTAIALPVSAWAAFVLCRRLTGRFWPALAGGAIFGFSAYQADHNAAGQLNLTFSLLIPLMAYLVLVWWQGDLNRWVFVGLLALGLVLQFYLFLETFAELVGVSVVALLVGFALTGRANWPRFFRLSRLMGLAFLISLVFVGPYMGYALTHVPPGFQRDPTVGSLDLASLVLQRPDATVDWFVKDITDHATRSSLGGYVGLPILALAVLLLAFGFRRKVVRFLFVMLVFVIAVSLGPVLTIEDHNVATLPWHRLWYLPVLRSAYPVRFMVFAYLILAVMVAVWLAGPWPTLAWFRRTWQRGLLTSLRWLVAAFAVTVVIMDLPKVLPQPWPTPPFFATSDYRVFLQPGETVIVQSGRGNAGMLWQAETGFYYKLSGGYVNAALAHYHLAVPLQLSQVAHSGATAASVRTLAQFLNKAKVDAIIVEESRAIEWPRLLHNIGMCGIPFRGIWFYEPGPIGWRLHAPAVRPARYVFPTNPGAPRVSHAKPPNFCKGVGSI